MTVMAFLSNKPTSNSAENESSVSVTPAPPSQSRSGDVSSELTQRKAVPQTAPPPVSVHSDPRPLLPPPQTGAQPQPPQLNTPPPRPPVVERVSTGSRLDLLSAFERADRDLNLTYKKVMSQLNSEGQERLKSAQRNWIKLKESRAGGDSTEDIRTRLNMTIERNAELVEILRN
jgi:hypothetical protein